MIRNIPDVVVFDLDGTLIDSMGKHAEVFASVVKKATTCVVSPDSAVELYRSTAGAPLIEQFKAACELASDVELQRLQANFWDFVNRVTFAPFDDAERCLTQLSAAGIPLAVSSGGSNASVARKLSDSGLARFFDIALGSDDPAIGEKGRDHFQLLASHFHPDRSAGDLSIVFVGDTEHDMVIARSVGATAVGLQRDKRLLPDTETDSDIRLDSLLGLPDLLIGERCR